MAIRFDISRQVKTSWAPSHLRSTRVEGWDRILREMRNWWREGTETIVETGFYERLKNVPRPKKPIEDG